MESDKAESGIYSPNSRFSAESNYPKPQKEHEGQSSQVISKQSQMAAPVNNGAIRTTSISNPVTMAETASERVVTLNEQTLSTFHPKQHLIVPYTRPHQQAPEDLNIILEELNSDLPDHVIADLAKRYDGMMPMKRWLTEQGCWSTYTTGQRHKDKRAD